jgi:putative polyhydroxyalkanoate system protein
MSEISVRRSHRLTLEQARKAAEKIAARLKQDFELDYAWQRHVLHFERPGLHGELHVGKDEVRLEAKLGFLLAFLKPRIEDEIDREFDRYFAAAKPAAPAKKAGRKRT